MKKWEVSAPVSRATEVCKTQAGWTFYSQCAALPSGKILQTPLMTPKPLMAGPVAAAPSLTQSYTSAARCSLLYCDIQQYIVEVRGN